ncbi:MAG: diaminopimelate epimerase [Kiritimatiellae bacterium]|nr:diaminopimelate epimerase [Kiritimatiellia bacterium]MDD4341193.1 diaminopimelate epimerase [Kiritimatiellia bacterium]
MNVSFWKMQAAGNDFILLDDRSGTFPVADSNRIARWCDRRRGIGSDGLILLQRSATADVRMRFFNPDGTEAAMCGNGARCVARLAHHLGLGTDNLRVDTAAGIVRADLLGDRVRLHLTPPVEARMHLKITGQGRSLTVHCVDTGVPHAVCLLEDVAQTDVAALGALVRHHPLFAPAGTNADFVQIRGPDALTVRTYERGVEAETLACGTGVAAAAWVAVKLGRVTSPVRVTTVGGDTLDVATDPLTLTGPAEWVFTGEIQTDTI